MDPEGNGYRVDRLWNLFSSAISFPLVWGLAFSVLESSIQIEGTVRKTKLFRVGLRVGCVLFALYFLRVGLLPKNTNTVLLEYGKVGEIVIIITKRPSVVVAKCLATIAALASIRDDKLRFDFPGDYKRRSLRSSWLAVQPSTQSELTIRSLQSTQQKQVPLSSTSSSRCLPFYCLVAFSI